jgi:hypothetical protein
LRKGCLYEAGPRAIEIKERVSYSRTAREFYRLKPLYSPNSAVPTVRCGPAAPGDLIK